MSPPSNLLILLFCFLVVFLPNSGHYSLFRQEVEPSRISDSLLKEIRSWKGPFLSDSRLRYFIQNIKKNHPVFHLFTDKNWKAITDHMPLLHMLMRTIDAIELRLLAIRLKRDIIIYRKCFPLQVFKFSGKLPQATQAPTQEAYIDHITSNWIDVEKLQTICSSLESGSDEDRPQVIQLSDTVSYSTMSSQRLTDICKTQLD